MTFLLCIFIDNAFIFHIIIYIPKCFQLVNSAGIRIIYSPYDRPQFGLYFCNICISINPQCLCIHMYQPMSRKGICHQPTVLHVQKIFIVISLKKMFLTQRIILFCQPFLCHLFFFHPDSPGNILMESYNTDSVFFRKISFSAAADIHFATYRMNITVNDLCTLL